MKESITSGPRKSLLTTIALALVALAAGPARAQTPADKPAAPAAGAPVDPAAAPPPPVIVAPAPTPEPLPPPPASPPPSPLPAPAWEPPVGAAAPEGYAHPLTEVPANLAEAGWFARMPLKVQFGKDKQAWAFTLFGTIQADYIFDTTRSYNDYIGQSLVARDDTYEGTTGRTQFGMRNSRIGFLLDSPSIGSVTPSAVFQLDFAGNQPSVPYVPPGSPGSAGISENAYYNNPTARIRHAYLTLRNPIVDILAGQTFDVFGWQNFYAPCALLGVPNQLSSRSAQFRLSKSFGAGGPVVVDIAVAAARPAQRDSRVPDVEGGVRLSVPGWKGITTPGNAVTIAAPLSIGVSGITRQFYVNAFTPPPAQRSNSTFGWGVSGDVFIPVIPAKHAGDRGNRLTLVGSFVYGTGIADMIVAGGGARFPTLPNPGQASPPPQYTPNVDNGLVTFDTLGVLHTIDWWAAKGAFQYYLPGSGRVFLAGNFTYAHSRNIGKLYPAGGTEIELLGSIADKSLSGDASLFFDATPAIRFGISGQYTQVRYLRNSASPEQEPYNIRGIAQALYTF
jgi:hypothetical protein